MIQWGKLAEWGFPFEKKKSHSKVLALESCKVFFFSGNSAAQFLIVHFFFIFKKMTYGKENKNYREVVSIFSNISAGSKT